MNGFLEGSQRWPRLAVIVVSGGMLIGCKAGPGPQETSQNLPAAAPATPEGSLPVEDSLLDHLESYFGRAREAGFAGAVSVARADGEVLFEAAAGEANQASGEPFTTGTAVDIGSNAKAFTAAAILLLAQESRLALEGTLAELLPGVPEDKAAITVHQLLTHTSGLPDELAGAPAYLSRDELQRAVLALPLLAAPGASYSYSDLGFALLAVLVERVAEIPYREFLRQRILAPAGLEATGPLDSSPWSFNGGPISVARGYNGSEEIGSPQQMEQKRWTPLGAGLILSTVGDGMRWMKSLLSHRVLDPSWTESMFTRQVEVRDGVWYGYGWVLRQDERRGRVISHSGASASHNWYSQYLEDDELFIITASNRIDGEYEDRNGDGEISDDEIVSETLYAIRFGAALAAAIHQGDFSIEPAFFASSL